MENIKIVKRVFDLFEAGKSEQISEHFSPNFIWVYYGPPEIAWAGAYYGHKGMQAFLETVAHHLTIENFIVEEFIDADDKVIVRGTSQARILSNGARYTARWINIFTLKEGKICEFEDLYDTAAILQAVQANKSSKTRGML